MRTLQQTSLLIAVLVLLVLIAPDGIVLGLSDDEVKMHPDPDRQTIQADAADEAAASGDGLVPVSLTVNIPHCRYRRADKRTALRSNITLNGVDARVRVIVGDSTVELSHHNLALHDIVRDRDGSIVEKKTPDTTCRYELRMASDQTIDVAVVTYRHTGRQFGERDRLRPVGKSCRIPADFNRGQPIHVRVTIDSTGDIIFKYW